MLKKVQGERNGRTITENGLEKKKDYEIEQVLGMCVDSETKNQRSLTS